MSEYICFRNKEVIARKKHDCKRCGDDIKKGDRYHDHVWLGDGKIHQSKLCDLCWEIIQLKDSNE